MKRLTAAEADRRLRSLKGWRRQGRLLVSVRLFDDFVGAMRWVNRAARVAELAGHHPDLLIQWNRVTVSLTTHDAGGLTSRDFALAAKLEALEAS